MRNTLFALTAALLLLTAFYMTPAGSNVANVLFATETLDDLCATALTNVHQNVQAEMLTFERVDLNDDGNDDRIVTLTDTASCGTSGCITELCVAQNGTGTLIPFGYAANEVRVLETRNANYFDLVINEAITVTFDGSRYVPAE